MSEERESVGAMFARDEQGRFASVESDDDEAPAAQPEAEAQQPAEATPEAQAQPAPAEQPKPDAQPAVVPLATFLEVQNELREYRRQQKAPQAQAAPPLAPSFYDDPDAYQVHLDQQLNDRLLGMKMEMSARFAMQQHGAQALEAAREWGAEQAAADPSFSQRFGNQPDPVGWLVSQHKQSELLSQIGEDPDAYVRRRAAELGLTAQAAEPAPDAQAAQLVQPQRAPVPTPPRSLATAPNAGGAESVPAAGIGAMFG